ncbi:TAFII55 protein conserved region containing protein, putative [Babesia bigemina]|uniref:TAFII55 protein conserved region containing protein, putative n=1 Tax=Babesia bigemina TaxID=5866 RepID=A0A061D598_BABBI|nr:TAFII55 protein conserved region containing protein, putative [Babesia bigemina]CDR94144.1 TAFII55 protein conserved region containing protein, putative [Babesia bigemina]|eukprot:XP_012766330.1 TAFII55 protein conserved region containing protein, putative [Babesia bigemina]
MSDNEASVESSLVDGQSDVTSVPATAAAELEAPDSAQDDNSAYEANQDAATASGAVASGPPSEVLAQPDPNPPKLQGFDEIIKGKLLARHGIFGAHEIYEEVLFNKPAKSERHSSKRLQYADSGGACDFSDMGSIDKHCIIRFPPDIAEVIRERSAANEDTGVSIEPTGRYDYREFVVRVRGVPVELMGILVELPCHLEAHKTLDCDMLFKAADVSQMIVVQERKEAEVTVEAMRQCMWEWPDGITPPTKNIRKRRFKDLDVYNNEEVKEAEREALNLLNGTVRDSYHYEVKSAQEVRELVESYRNGNIKERIIGLDEDVQEYIKAVQQFEPAPDDSEIMFNGDHSCFMKQ